MRIMAFLLILSGLLANLAVADDACKPPAPCTEVQTCGSENHCCRCGQCCTCNKYCKIVCEMKEVKKTVWNVKCKEVCPLLPNCGHCCDNCDACECDVCKDQSQCSDGHCKKPDPCAAEKAKCFIPPKCGRPREVKTLEKKEVICKVPSYKCVVSYVCPNCCHSDGGNDKAPTTAPSKAEPAPAPGKTTREDAPLPPVAGVSFVTD